MSVLKLQQERTNKLAQLKSIFSICEAEKRQRNASEMQTFTRLESEIKKLDADIVDLQKLTSRMNQNESETNEQRNMKKYDLFKAVREQLDGNLTGLEREMHQEAVKEFREAGQSLNGLGIPSMAYKRADIDTVTGASVMQKSQKDGLSIIKSQSITERLGVQKLTGLQGKLEGYSHGQLNANFVAEKAAVNEPDFTPGVYSLQPRRIGLTLPFYKEYFAQTNISVHSAFLQEFYNAIQRGVDKDFISKIITNSAIVHPDYTEATAKKLVDLGTFIDLETLLESEALDNLAYLTTRKVKGKMKATSTDSGSGVMAWRNDEINSYPAYATTLLDLVGAGSDQHPVIFGNWSDGLIGQWGALEMIVDVITGKNTGKIEVTVNGLYDSDIQNPDSFVTALNCSV